MEDELSILKMIARRRHKMSETTELTPGQIRTRNRKAAVELLIKSIERGKGMSQAGTEQILPLLKPSGQQHDALVKRFIALIESKKTMAELDLFNALQIGRPGARQLMCKAVNQAQTANERVWILFDGKSYTFVNRGPLPKVAEGDEWGRFLPKGLK